MTIKYKDLGSKKLAQNMKLLSQLGAKIGYVGPLGEASHGNVNMATLAGFMEFGTDDIPARPFLRTFYKVYASEIQKIIAEENSKIFTEGKDPIEVWKVIAKKMALLALERFDTASSWADPLDPATIKEKGSSTPLVDSGKLRDYLGWAVTKNGRIIDYGKAN